MRRDPHTGAPDFFGFARDYLHAYMPKVRGLPPKTIEAYRISLECFLDYLAEAEHIGREHVSFDHFERQHLKGWLTWKTDQRHYTPKTVTLKFPPNGGHRDSGTNGPAGRMSPCPEPAGLSRPNTRSRPPIG